MPAMVTKPSSARPKAPTAIRYDTGSLVRSFAAPWSTTECLASPSMHECSSCLRRFCRPSVGLEMSPTVPIGEGPAQLNPAIRNDRASAQLPRPREPSVGIVGSSMSAAAADSPHTIAFTKGPTADWNGRRRRRQRSCSPTSKRGSSAIPRRSSPSSGRSAAGNLRSSCHRARMSRPSVTDRPKSSSRSTP
jgi:hypothetical protein